jgi:hypothetical protein
LKWWLGFGLGGDGVDVLLVIHAVSQCGPKVAQRTLHTIGHGLLAGILNGLPAVLLVDDTPEANVLMECPVAEEHAYDARVPDGPAFGVTILILVLL